MSDSDSDIDAIMAQADDDAPADAGAGDEEASEDSIDALFGDDAGGGDGPSIDDILGESGGEVAETMVAGVARPDLSKFEDRAVQDVAVELSVVLGRSQMPIHQLLKMGRGAVIELDATTEDDCWVYANNRLIARGEVMVVGENLGVSITENVTKSGD
jgi:flagellar motor switch protein FliN/FliY